MGRHHLLASLSSEICYDILETLETGIAISVPRQVSSAPSVTPGAALKDKLLVPQMGEESLELQMLGREL